MISFRTDWLNLLAVQGTLKSLQHHNLQASSLRRSAFFMVQLSYPYVTTGNTITYIIGGMDQRRLQGDKQHAGNSEGAIFRWSCLCCGGEKKEKEEVSFGTISPRILRALQRSPESVTQMGEAI